MKRFLALCSATLILMSCSMIAFADETSDPYIPDNEVTLSDNEQGNVYKPQGGSSSQEQSTSQGSNQGSSQGETQNNDPFNTDNIKDVTGELFDMSDFKIEKTSDNKLIKILNSKGVWLISIICGIFPFLVLFHMAVDILCMLSPFVRGFFVKCKHQYFSDEVAQAFGFSLQSGGNSQQGYTGGVTPPPATPAGGQQGPDAGSAVSNYVKARIGRIFMCLLLLVLCGSGQLFRILGWVVNLVIHLSSFVLT